ncbi:MAG: universal stress protein, partial [Pseudomonadota bacterium]
SLLMVHSKIPEAYWDLESMVSLGWQVREVRAWQGEYERVLQGHMDQGKKILWRAEFPKAAVKVKMHERERGVARDIIREAKKGYSCLVIGRKGMGKVKDLALGSVSNKLLEKITFVPLIVVGKDPRPGTLLLALDGSECSMRAVDCVGNLLGGSDYDVGLIHVIRGDKGAFVKEAKERITKVFDEVKGRLVKSGFGSDQVTTKIITGAQSRAGAIVQEAKEGGYGTIVMGRRGLSKVQEFFMGRVSNKVIQMAKGQAVWIVS